MLATLSTAMRRTAARARSRAADVVSGASVFALSRLNEDGGFRDRAGASDLYYTLFGIECLLAAGETGPGQMVADYVAGFGDGATLNCIHLVCLARCLACLESRPPPAERAREILARLESYRCRDNGYHTTSAGEHGSAYGCFLVRMAYEDLRIEPPAADGWRSCLEYLRADDGGYANEAGLAAGTTPATAAAVTLLAQLGQPLDGRALAWLEERRLDSGGFAATPGIPLADLLSTATALFALRRAGLAIEGSDACEAFVLGLRDDDGGFRGSEFDALTDCEYTFYGLLALGCLSEDEWDRD